MDTSTLPATRTIIRYRNTVADHLYLNFYALLRSPTAFVILGVAHFLVVYDLFVGTSETSMPTWIRLVATGCMAGLVILFATALIAALAALAVVLITRSNKTSLIERSVTLSYDAIIEETEFNRSEHKWVGIHRVARKHGYIIVFVAPYLAHIIPQRAFANSAEFDRFYSEIQARVAKTA